MHKLISILLVALVPPVLGFLGGGLTNAINGAVSPAYFRVVMGWERRSNIWGAAVEQGMLEGTIYGIIFSAIFTTVYIIATRGDCPFERVVPYLLRITLITLAFWTAGGILGTALYSIVPFQYRAVVDGVPREFVPYLAFGWVHGSILGAVVGAVVTCLVGSTVVYLKWKPQPPTADPDDSELGSSN